MASSATCRVAALRSGMRPKRVKTTHRDISAVYRSFLELGVLYWALYGYSEEKRLFTTPP
jgi:hypothetical protein